MQNIRTKDIKNSSYPKVYRKVNRSDGFRGIVLISPIPEALPQKIQSHKGENYGKEQRSIGKNGWHHTG